MIRFRAENLRSINKRNIASEMAVTNPRNGSTTRSTRDSIQVKMMSSYVITSNYFNTRSGQGLANKNLVLDDESFTESYQPRLFKIMSKGQSYIELYIGYHENKRIIHLEGKSPKKPAVFREIYIHEITENEWYSLVITYNPKTTVSLIIFNETI